jgi:S-adenosylmethionine-dependent methyltransferase
MDRKKTNFFEERSGQVGSTAPNTFDKALSQWITEQNQPWGRLKYQLAQANLAKHIGDEPLQILDAGGGNGLDALALAAQGHSVDLVDYSSEMLAQAEQQANENSVSDRLRIHQADVRDVVGLFPPSHFDFVVCHNVLQYIEDVTALLTGLAVVLKPSGLLSLISINRYSMAYHAAFLRDDLTEAFTHLDARTMQAHTFDAVLTNYSPDEICAMLQGNGWQVEADYGLRCMSDYWGDNERKADPAIFARLERLEYALTDRYPYKLLARYFQIIARRA